MRELNECRTEIFWRSAKRIQARRKMRSRVLGWGVSLCLLIAVCSVIPLLPKEPANNGPVLDGTQNLVVNDSGVGGNKSETPGNCDGIGSIHASIDGKAPQSTGSSAGVDGSMPGKGGTDMKKTRMILTIVSLLLVCAITMNLTGCSTKVQAENLMDGITPNAVAALDDLSTQDAKVTDFAVRLLKVSEKRGENTLISPLSVLCALAMTANGAENETLSQMETVLGMTTEELNLYLYSYVKNLPQGEKYKLSLANSIWFTDDDRFTVNQDFLQTNADYYSADVYETPFDNQTCKDINNWVKQKTDGMIPKILDQIPETAVMYLVNALAFEAEWMDIYEKNQVKDGKFTKENGTKQDAAFMYGTEHIYLEDDYATGFMKKYRGGKYAFVAMLPNEGVSVSEYIASLDGKTLNALLTNPKYAMVHTAIPKFETEYDVEMSNILKEMGMPNAFDSNNAEFGRLGSSTDGNIYISRVLHKTFISVGEKGTKAGASTVVEMSDGCVMQPEEPKEVCLDRPFVYMLIDCENDIPFFIGTMMDIKQ